jgi:hypothetical protein
MPTDTSPQRDSLQALVTAFAEATMVDPGDKPLPMATADADEVIRAQLTENTGAHFLDSGSHYGRHYERNQTDPPWEQPEWDVQDGYVIHNVYHYMDRVLSRSRACVSLEAALYAFGYTDDRRRESWPRTMEAFAESLLEGNVHDDDLRDLGLPQPMVDHVLGIQHELQPDRARRRRGTHNTTPFTYNTYNGGCHDLSQVLQGANIGGPHAEYVMLQVHGGADMRGGYTGPRVYEATSGLPPLELEYMCDRCDWQDAESVLYGDESLVYQRSVSPFELEDAGHIAEGDDEVPALAAAYDADDVDGAVFHKCDDGGLGHVRVH